MAGLGSLDTIYQTFLGQTNDALNEPQAPWQQELMETVNPEKVRRDNIKRALAQASMALATTPGNFMEGLSVAAGAGANSYLNAQQDAEQQRMRAMQLVHAAQQKQNDRRLALLMDAIGVNRDIKSDKQAEEETAYRRDRDKKADARQAKLDDSLIASRTRPRASGVGSVDGSGMTSGQVLTTKRAIRREIDGFERQLREDQKFDENLTDEQIEQMIEQRRIELEDYYGISLDSAEVQTPAGGKEDQVVNKRDTAAPAKEGILPAQPQQSQPQQAQPIKEGTTAINKKTGERIIYRNGQWQPIL